MTTSEHTEPTRLRMLSAESWRFGIIAVIAFLTLVDLFATQAILPSLVTKFGVSRATMGVAVNASTFGMAVAGIAVALFGRNLDRRNGIWISLAVLAIPTTLLSQTDSIVAFGLLRVVQGLCMSTAFTLTMAYLAEHFSARQTTGALAAYVTGNVASNFFGRLMSAAVADTFGISTNFLTFAALNLIGAALVWLTLQKTSAMTRADAIGEPARAAWKGPLKNVELRACFAIGFLILFVFIGTFTYVNFQLVTAPLSLSPMALGLVYFVFLPSMLTTPLAGRLAAGLGPRIAIGATLTLAILGLLLLLTTSLPIVLGGMALVAIGTFLAQAIATGHVSRTASRDRTAASGIYLASYYTGGLAGSFVIGQIYDRIGWTACVAVLAAVLAGSIAVARSLKSPTA
ncbi:MAG: MFS transporter [Mesorhizobium sp.]|uniref:MFS transporter n=1 Tax=Mesorhizobium sp. TaxID=1871066 RepID=UPI000FE81D9E|nr:MFS transporter [Mesorhizobium sp.]RWL19088.1 MAG: MFS transporter [Mesorhizobium sp.]